MRIYKGCDDDERRVERDDQRTLSLGFPRAAIAGAVAKEKRRVRVVVVGHTHRRTRPPLLSRVYII